MNKVKSSIEYLGEKIGSWWSFLVFGVAIIIFLVMCSLDKRKDLEDDDGPAI